MNTKLVNESLNEFIGQGADPETILCIFIDEQHFDYYADDLDHDPYDGEYEGFSEIPVYEIPLDDLDDLEYEEDPEKVNMVSDNRDNYPIVGKVLVGFKDEEIEILKIVDDEFHIDTLDNIAVLFPSI